MCFGFDQFKKIQKKIYTIYLKFVINYLLDEGGLLTIDILCLQPRSENLHTNPIILAAFFAVTSKNIFLHYLMYRFIFHNIDLDVKISRFAFGLHLLYNLCISNSFIPFILASILSLFLLSSHDIIL